MYSLLIQKLSMQNWQEIDHALQAHFSFENFTTAFAFMTEVAFAAEQQEHHPNWSNVYNQVHFRLCTHDAGNRVTDKDHRLAATIDAIFEKYRLDE